MIKLLIMNHKSGFKTKEDYNAYMRIYNRKYRQMHRKPSHLQKLLMRAIELKMAFDLPNNECVERAMEEVKTK
jgi:hypothetical protein